MMCFGRRYRGERLLDPPAGRGAARVGDGRRGGDEHRLLDVALGEGDAAGGEEGAELPLGVGVDEHLLAEHLRDRLAGEVVLGGAEAAGHDDDVGALERALDGVGEAVEVIADGGLVVEVEADGGQAGGDPLGVGVDDFAEEDLGADGDEFGAHDGQDSTRYEVRGTRYEVRGTRYEERSMPSV